ncbi:halocyanin domain-containing protein, partial [Halapricum sp. CBA1109]|nr:halocyanin domain-containing protein [Halapricum sp. CBA1109]
MPERRPSASRRASAASGLRRRPGFDGWLSNTSNYDGLVDERGSDEVVVDVGVQGNNGTNGFGPAAVRV